MLLTIRFPFCIIIKFSSFDILLKENSAIDLIFSVFTVEQILKAF